MRLIPFIIPLTAIFTSASSFRVTHSIFFGIRDHPSTTVACGTQLVDAGYPTFGSLPSFSNIGASYAVGTIDSPDCGSCWNISYTRSDDKTTTAIYVTAVDPASYDEFVVSPEAFSKLEGQQALYRELIYVEATRVQKGYCGL
jgi:hypothetical protein